MRRYLIFATAGFSLLMYSIDSTAVAVAFPTFIREFDTSVLLAGWTLSIYLVAITSVMPLAGKLSESFGRKKVFLISLLLFSGSSLACGLAPNIESLIAFRFFQGVGGASFLPTSAGIVTDLFPDHRERCIGLFSSIFPIGGIIGPNLGGWIVSRYSWRYIFYINLPIGILLIGSVLLLLKKSKVSSRFPIDFMGASFFFGAVLFLMFGLNLVAHRFSTSSLLLAAVLWSAGLVLILLFLRHEEKTSNPILDIALLRTRPFLAANLFNMLLGVGVFGIWNFIPYYATSVLKWSTLASGMIMTPASVGNILAAGVISFLLKRWGYRKPMILGLVTLSVATVLLDQGFQPWRWLGIDLGIAEKTIFIVMLMGVGIGTTFPASNNACIELRPDKVATITGLRGTCRSVGGALGVSIVTVILHLSPRPEVGFRIAFVCFGLGLLFSMPLIFLMPAGKKVGG